MASPPKNDIIQPERILSPVTAQSDSQSVNESPAASEMNLNDTSNIFNNKSKLLAPV